MSDRDDLLPSRLCRRNWLLWSVLMALSLLWRSAPVFFGMAAGGLIAISGFYWLRWSLSSILFDSEKRPSRRYSLTILIRLMVLAGLIALLIGSKNVSISALAIGLSVVVLNLLILALERMMTGTTYKS